MTTGRTTKPVPASKPFRASDYLHDESDIAAYLETVLEDGDARVVPVALRTVAEAMGGMTSLAERTGLSRETLYRTLSDKGNPRLDTLTTILGAFGLRMAVAPARPDTKRRPRAADAP
ncbi:addiction module antidote protein [Luteimonas salinilitoris]|uniref:Addiction module antidote protein n=1 Tax=Luteimonas salinilitoris TaxID=3237697 RepID=A0ABV4HST7_9GAMM